MPEYFAIPDVPGKQFFQCGPQRATLSTEACAKNWRLGNHENSEARTACKCCPIGALHAGEAGASMSPMKGTKICARCHRPAIRLIHGMNCVSCYNREREQTIGRNAKGTPPVKLAALQRRRLRYMSGDKPVLMVMERALDTLELVVAALRDSRNRVRLAFHVDAPRGLFVQMRLF